MGRRAGGGGGPPGRGRCLRGPPGPPGGRPPGGPPSGNNNRDWNDLEGDDEGRYLTGKINGHVNNFDGDQTKARKFQNEFEIVRMLNPRHQLFCVPMQRTTLALSYIKGDAVDEWCHEYADHLADEVYQRGVTPTNKRLWDDFILDFVQRFWDTGEEERSWALLQHLEMKENDLDGYIMTFNTLIKKAGRDRDKVGHVDVFKQGLKTWLL